MKYWTHINDSIYKSLMTNWKCQVRKIAHRYSVALSDVEIQLKLHLPLIFNEKGIPDTDLEVIPNILLKIIDLRFSSYQKNHEEFIEKSGTSKLRFDDSIIANNCIVSSTENYIFNFADVENNTGNFIEKNLHYLRIEKKNDLRIGLFLEDKQMPICYMSYHLNDREYKSTILSQIIESTVMNSDIANLSRVYGFGNLPKNTISKMIAYSVTRLKSLGVDYIISAVNPFMGFNGTSLLASGFVPFAYCPVIYRYDITGSYVNVRATWEVDNRIFIAPNLLFVKGMSCRANKSLRKINKILTINLSEMMSEISNSHTYPLQSHSLFSEQLL